MPQQHGTFEKNGVTKTAYTPAEAVKLKFDGWARVDEPAAEDVAAVPDQGETPSQDADPKAEVADDPKPKPPAARWAKPNTEDK